MFGVKPWEMALLTPDETEQMIEYLEKLNEGAKPRATGQTFG